MFRDDIDIQFVDQFGQPVHQRFAGKQALFLRTAAQDQFRDAADPGILRDLNGRIFSIDGGDPGPQFFGQTQIGLKPAVGGLVLRLEIRRFDKESGQTAVKGLGQPGTGANDSDVGRGTGQANEDSLFTGKKRSR